MPVLGRALEALCPWLKAGRQGISRSEAMALTGHKSSSVFDSYYESGSVLKNKAALLAEE